MISMQGFSQASIKDSSPDSSIKVTPFTQDIASLIKVFKQEKAKSGGEVNSSTFFKGLTHALHTSFTPNKTKLLIFSDALAFKTNKEKHLQARRIIQLLLKAGIDITKFSSLQLQKEDFQYWEGLARSYEPRFSFFPVSYVRHGIYQNKDKIYFLKKGLNYYSSKKPIVLSLNKSIDPSSLDSLDAIKNRIFLQNPNKTFELKIRR